MMAKKIPTEKTDVESNVESLSVDEWLQWLENRLQVVEAQLRQHRHDSLTGEPVMRF